MGYKDKEKQKEYQRLWMLKRRKEVMVGKSCKECNSNYDLNVVGIKTHKKVSISNKNIKTIIDKSVILCGNCYFLHMQKLNTKLATTHGHSKKTGSQSYHTWRGMRERCTNPNRDNYKWYGAKGVKVCKRWDRFENFLKDMGEKPEGMSLDRINPEGDYKPSNCRWATWEQQGLNKRKKFFDEEKIRK